MQAQLRWVHCLRLLTEGSAGEEQLASKLIHVTVGRIHFLEDC